ncbi:hypothetical protein FCN80_07040 [Martelella alba]|uniref:Uncharacterized protein n=1 Tax=Martelella alba TaxID=2590451 RepID=A0ABY2SPH2_9HYPH|nr:hypothetical protein FCN80_07040 [Martelella alba]
MAVRTYFIDQPVRLLMPVIRPSRGPGPKFAPIYIAVAMALMTIPPSNSPPRRTISSTGGSSDNVASATTPSTITLLTVPRPGNCRRGIHNTKTAAPTKMMT